MLMCKILWDKRNNLIFKGSLLRNLQLRLAWLDNTYWSWWRYQRGPGPIRSYSSCLGIFIIYQYDFLSGRCAGLYRIQRWQWNKVLCLHAILSGLLISSDDINAKFLPSDHLYQRLALHWDSKLQKYKIQNAKFLPSDHLCQRLALHWDGQRLSRPARFPHRREDIARRLHQVLAQYLQYSIFSMTFNMFLQLTNLKGTWSGPICRWCSPPRTGTCWGAPWSTWQGLALSQAWGWPAGLMMGNLVLNHFFNFFRLIMI